MPVAANDNAERYLELLKRALTNEIYYDHEFFPFKRNNALRRGFLSLARSFKARVTRDVLLSDEQRANGMVVAPMGHTAIGRKRLDNLHNCLRTAIVDGVQGDVIETGVWRGGAVIFMRGALNAYGQHDRIAYAADSFEGLPAPDPKYSKDAGAKWHTRDDLSVSFEQVYDHFRRYDLLEGVEFLRGWFKDTLPDAPFKKLMLARLDGDMYGSTMDALTNLYDKVSPGGYLLIDDYGGVPACKAAVDDFRAERGITEPIENVDWTGVWWRKG